MRSPIAAPRFTSDVRRRRYFPGASFAAFAVAALGEGAAAAPAELVPPLTGPPSLAIDNRPVDTFADTADANVGDGVCADATGACSLRAAIQEANADPDLSRIFLGNGTYTLSLAGAGEDSAATGDLDVTTPITVIGSGSDSTVIDAAGLDRAFDVLAGAALEVRGVTLANGAPPEGESGGGIRSAGDVRLADSAVSKGLVRGTGASGGALFNDGGRLLVLRSILESNRAARAGGAVEANAGQTDVLASRLEDNIAGPMPGNGGGLHLTGDGAVKVLDSFVMNNTAAAEGGGLWNSSGGDMTVQDTVLEHNTASGDDATQGGGALFNDGGNLYARRVQVSGNLAIGAAGSGGGILNDGGAFILRDSVVRDNRASRAGGAVEANAGSTLIRDSELARNSAGPSPGNGGGLHLTGDGDVRIVSTNVVDNLASAEGGGLWNSAVGLMEVRNSLVTGNRASGADPDQGGGGLFNDGGTLAVADCNVSSNVADGAAGSCGGILNNGGFLDLFRGVANENTANRAGGAVEANAGTTVVRGTQLARNRVGPSPGNGGALHLTGAGTVEVRDASVLDNIAAAEGGGLWNSAAGGMEVKSSLFSGNVASGADADQGGGALFNDGGSMRVTSTQITGNLADGSSGSGGGILNDGGVLFVGRVIIEQNVSMRAGGGIEANVGTTRLNRVDLRDNQTGSSPGNGGGLHLTGAGDVLVTNGSATGNQAAAEGGGFWNSATGTMIVNAATIAGNSAPVGPDTFNDGGTFLVDGMPQ